ncbi:flagellar basal body-associated protein FliL [Serratia sp. M24T3]|uniref:flagellar basal body-associated FliL family protein n=1 Tax=Serratia sp. M24T3 TaxID=932213 RepID=UPI00025B93E0|nr:flagellar basal body-associated FliL family protein [Serratia sp. M24T3]EIC83883.1 putative flagellar biogenesis protein [Serratia sp. M24T3]
MNIKKILIILFSALLAAIVADILITYVNPLILQNDQANLTKVNHKGQKDIHFVEVKNIIITLQSSEGRERYLLLELALSTDSEANMNRTTALLPAVRSSTVDLLSNLDFKTIHDLSIPELRKKMMAAYERDFTTLDITMPFDNVIISKIVYQ